MDNNLVWWPEAIFLPEPNNKQVFLFQEVLEMERWNAKQDEKSRKEGSGEPVQSVYEVKKVGIEWSSGGEVSE